MSTVCSLSSELSELDPYAARSMLFLIPIVHAARSSASRADSTNSETQQWLTRYLQLAQLKSSNSRSFIGRVTRHSAN